MTQDASARVTLLDLVKTVQDTARSDQEAVEVLAHMFRTRRVVYTPPVTTH